MLETGSETINLNAYHFTAISLDLDIHVGGVDSLALRARSGFLRAQLSPLCHSPLKKFNLVKLSIRLLNINIMNCEAFYKQAIKFVLSKCVCVFIYMHACTCMYVCMYVCMNKVSGIHVQYGNTSANLHFLNEMASKVRVHFSVPGMRNSTQNITK